MHISKKALFVTILCGGIFLAQGFAQNEHRKHDDEKPTNLKVLPQNISGEDLHKIMKAYSMALGVHCNYCHVSQEVPGEQRPKMDFASDDKHEKLIARDMMRMVEGINANYISKMGSDKHTLEQVTCVTCHMGRTTPIVSVDSLKKS